MELRDPIAVYTAATNIEAQLIKMLLTEAGVEAFAAEDLSTAGLWMFGALPEIHKPQVWVSSQDHDRARRIVQEYERQTAERNQALQEVESNPAKGIEVLCEDCSKRSSFPSSQRGTVQECPHCGAYVDVGDIDQGDAFWLEGDEVDDE